MTTFQFRYDQWCGWLLGLLGAGRRFSRIDVSDTEVDVRLGWAFRGVVPRSAIVRVSRWDGRVLGWGAHGWRGRWLVNGSSKGILILHIDPPTKGRVAGVKVNVAELALSFEDPEGFLAAIAMSAD